MSNTHCKICGCKVSFKQLNHLTMFYSELDLAVCEYCERIN